MVSGSEVTNAFSLGCSDMNVWDISFQCSIAVESELPLVERKGACCKQCCVCFCLFIGCHNWLLWVMCQ